MDQHLSSKLIQEGTALGKSSQCIYVMLKRAYKCT